MDIIVRTYTCVRYYTRGQVSALKHHLLSWETHEQQIKEESVLFNLGYDELWWL